MKQTYTRIAFILLLISLVKFSNAQTVYNITTNTSTSSFGGGVICTNCDVVISPGIILTINSTCTCTTCTFSGGTISIASGSNLTLSGTDSFKNETVILNQSVNSQTLIFYGDTVAFNASMNLSNNTTTIDSSRVSVNAALTLDRGVFVKDSLHLNSNLSLSNASNSFSGSNVDVASGVTIASNTASFTNSTFAFAGSSAMTVSNGMTSTGSGFYLAGTSTITSNSTTSIGTSIINMSGTNTFTASNALPITNSDITINSTSALKASSLTVTGGSVNNSGSIVSSNAASFSGDTLTMSGASTLTASSFSSTINGAIKDSINLSGSASIKISNAITFSGTNVDMSGSSAVNGASGSFTSGSLTQSGTSVLSVTNNFTYSAARVLLGGNSVDSASTILVQNNSFVQIGDGTTGTAHLTSINNMTVQTTASVAIADHNNYFHTNSSNYTGAAGSINLPATTGSCGSAGENACMLGFVFGCATMSNAAANSCAILAISDLSLSAVKTSTDAVALSWSDAQSATAGHYVIQRSAGNNDWTTLGVVDATVNAVANGNGDYHFEDQNAPAGTDDYRITRIDQDGNTLYSPISTITINRPASTINIYPNPATGHTFFITTLNTGQITVNIFTLTGQMVTHKTLQGQMQYPIQLPSQLLPGTAVIVETISQTGTLSFPLLLR
jgi:hypothetical protein